MKFSSVASPAESLAPSTDKKQLIHKRNKSHAWKKHLNFWIFVGPFFLGLMFFGYVPIIWSLYLSLFEARSTISPTEFVGLANYVSMLTDSSFLQSLGTFILFALFIVPTTFFLALGLALLVNSVSVFRGFFRSVFFLPTACSYVVASLIWKMSIFNGLPFGLANQLRNIFGLDPLAWVATVDPPYYWIVLVTARLWLQLGFYMIIFIAGLQEIPGELYEAARVDGAKQGWTTFRNITFPLLRNTSVAVLILNLIAAFQAFDEFYNIVGPTQPQGRPPLLYLYNVALGSADYGRGSAGAWILAMLILLFTLLQGKVFGFGKANG